ncbi:uncharacterized protein [Haliotis cracherodii]|uniref:uncharacterized protein n=1 Tax=Haliotis cracherodii TaxID=6455 RepID=UPI0039EA7F5E
MVEGCLNTLWILLVIFHLGCAEVKNDKKDIPNYRLKTRERDKNGELMVLSNPGSLEDLDDLLADGDLNADGIRSRLDEENINWKTLSSKEQKSLMGLLKTLVTTVGEGDLQLPNSSMQHIVETLIAKVALLEIDLNNQTKQTTSALKELDELKASCSRAVSGLKEANEWISNLKLKMERSDAEVKTRLGEVELKLKNRLDAEMKDIVAIKRKTDEIEKMNKRGLEKQMEDLRAEVARRPGVGVNQTVLREGDRCSVLDQQALMLYGMWKHMYRAPDKGSVKVTTATASSVGWGGVPSRAVDGNKSPRWGNRGCSHTNTEMNPWLLLKLQGISNITGVELTNRGDCCDRRLSDFVIETYMNDPTTSPDEAATKCFHYTGTVGRAATVLIKCNSTIQALYVKITIVKKTPAVLTICEAVVKGQLIGITSAKQVIQSSMESAQTAPVMANDGDKSTCSQTMADSIDSDPWWQIDLGKMVAVHTIYIRNRNDEKYVWLRNMTVTVHKEFPSICADVTPHLCSTYPSSVGQGQVVTMTCQKPITGRYLKIKLGRNTIGGALSLCEVSVNDRSMIFG